MSYLHKVRFATHGTETHIFLDDQEVKGCTSANFDYQMNSLPLVKLELTTCDVEVDAESAIILSKEDEST